MGEDRGPIVEAEYRAVLDMFQTRNPASAGRSFVVPDPQEVGSIADRRASPLSWSASMVCLAPPTLIPSLQVGCYGAVTGRGTGQSRLDPCRRQSE